VENYQSLFVIDAGKCFGAPPPVEIVLQNGDRTAEGVLDTERGPKHFPRQLKTNFESFPNSCCLSRDCRLTGYLFMNM
jgi:hypothetical protein